MESVAYSEVDGDEDDLRDGDVVLLGQCHWEDGPAGRDKIIQVGYEITLGEEIGYSDLS